MNPYETKAAAMLAGRVVAGMREFTPEQRKAALGHVLGEYCATCGSDRSACKCFAEVDAPVVKTCAECRVVDGHSSTCPLE